MKKGILIGIFLCIVCVFCMGAAKKLYWHDAILKPDQTWVEKYGHSDKATLAFGVWALTQTVNQQTQVLAMLKKKIEALKAVDPNEVTK